METSLSVTEDQLVDSLSFKLPSTANYILDRQDVTFFPANGNEFSPTGVKILRFHITGTGRLDPRSVRIQFKLNNRDNENDVYLIDALPHNFSRRLRSLAGGALIEDIDYYNRIMNMLLVLYPAEKRINDAVEGFGHYTSTRDENYDRGVLNIMNEAPVLKKGHVKSSAVPTNVRTFRSRKVLTSPIFTRPTDRIGSGKPVYGLYPCFRR